MLRGVVERTGVHAERLVKATRWRTHPSSVCNLRHLSSKTDRNAEASTSTSSNEPSRTGSAVDTSNDQDNAQLLSRLSGWTVQNGANLRQRMDEVTAMAAARASRLGHSLNKVTGYHEIELLKKAVVENERRMHEARQAAKDAKAAYDQAVLRRSTSQREVNDLLQRKSSWTEDDVLRFTRLVREDHVVEQEEARAKALAMQSDDAVDKHFNELMRSILSRYHEEQAWSDKIRSASTYGSLLALGLNLVVFISAIVVVEPWKRKRMVRSFESTVHAMHEEMKAMVDGRLEQLALHQSALGRSLEDMQVDLKAPHDALGYDQNLIPAVDATLDLGVADEDELHQRFGVPLTALAFIGAGAVGWALRSWAS